MSDDVVLVKRKRNSSNRRRRGSPNKVQGTVKEIIESTAKYLLAISPHVVELIHSQKKKGK